jgi:putative DNA methylase
MPIPLQLSLDLHYPQREETETSGVPIDEAFPEAAANELARKESFNKHLYRPNTYLHKWWARRSGTTFRHILKQLVADPDKRDFYEPGGLTGKVVLDPMMGGATTLHEAIRLGTDVIGADIDPIPVVQARATLTHAELKELRAAFDQFFADLYTEVGDYFQTGCPGCDRTLDAQYTLHGLRKQCSCSEVVQVDQYELRYETGRTLRIWPDTWEISAGEQQPPSQPKRRRLVTKADSVCPTCSEKYSDLLEVPFYARYVPVAVVGTCSEHGLFLRPPGESDLARIDKADQLRGDLDFGPAEYFAVRGGPKSDDLLGRNIHSYLDLFSSRQLLYLHQAVRLLDSYSGVVKLNLALLVSTSLEFNAMLCGYKGADKRRAGAVRHVFALHAYAFPYTALENNPVNRDKSSGNLQLLFRDRIERGRTWAKQPRERKITSSGQTQVVKIRGEVDVGTEVFDQRALADARQAFWLIQGDSRRLPVDDRSVDFIVTDPPYYDNVQYSDLASFFHVWLARLLPDGADWDYDHVHSAVATKAVDDDTQFMRVLGGIFKECGRVLKRDRGRLVFTYHHWDANAWAELNIALKEAGFRLVNVYVVFSENPISVHINNLNAIKHDAILVLALDGDLPPGRWPSPEPITTSESDEFCCQCGQALGWLLDEVDSPAEIRATWSQLIQSKSNGKRKRR